jgi:hypothetical protein
MITNIPIAFRSRRVGKASSTPPVLGPHILSITHGGTNTQVVVALSEDLQAFDGIDMALRVKLADDSWAPSADWDGSDLMNVIIDFGQDVSSATEWVVPQPSVWLFTGGVTLDVPYSGVVA